MARGDERQDADEESLRLGRNVGLGCFTLFIGGVSGGMVGVLVAQIASSLRRCTPVEGLPACDWQWYWMVGAVVGALSLPLLVLLRLRRRPTGRPAGD